MYLKVEIDGEEELYSFPDQSEITIGRSPESDIQLLVEGISRNHSKVIKKKEDYFYVDIGSSMGSFVNDEQLNANVETTFNSFFPIRLGESAFLYLMDEVISEEVEEDIKPEENLIEIKTEVNQPKDKHKPMIYVPDSAGQVKKPTPARVKTEGATKKVAIKRKRTIPRGKKVKKVNHTQRLLMFLLIAVFVGFFGYRKYEKLKIKEMETIFKIEKQKKDAIEKEKQELIRKEMIAKNKAIKQKEKKQRDELINAINGDKCLLELESFMCINLDKYKKLSQKEGYIKLFSDLILVLDIDSLRTFLNKKYNISYTNPENEKAIQWAKDEIGNKFHLGYFKNKMNYRITRLNRNKEYFKLVMLINILDSGIVEQIQSVTDIKKLSLVAMRDDGYLHHATIDFIKLKEMKSQKIDKFVFKSFFRSSITKPIKKIFYDLSL
jgi:pSer/pThr/pTyr-binding forkhead associated (FHA) protein